MTCTTPLPERLDPPDTASECAICHRVTEDGRDMDLCDEAVDALLDAGAIRRNAAVDTGVQFVCESCLDDLHDAQERHRAEAFDTISDALDMDVYEHPALRARKVIAASRLRTVQPGDEDRFDLGFVEACAILAAKPFDQPTMARNIIREGGVESALLATQSDYVGIDILRNEMRDDLDALRARPTTTEKEAT